MAADMKKALAPAMVTLIEELAKRAARDYLTERAAAQSQSAHAGSNRVALPDVNKAA